MLTKYSLSHGNALKVSGLKHENGTWSRSRYSALLKFAGPAELKEIRRRQRTATYYQ